MTEVRPVTDPEFWRKRLVKAHATGRGLHTAVYDTNAGAWESAQRHSAKVFRKHFLLGNPRVLDAGCGFGASCLLMPAGVRYVGIDISPDLIEVARERYPGAEFVVGDLSQLPPGWGRFDWVVLRSIRKMLVREKSEEYWNKVRDNLLSVAGRILVMEYEDLPAHDVLTRTGSRTFTDVR